MSTAPRLFEPLVTTTWDLTTATSFEIMINPFQYSIARSGPGWTPHVGEDNFSAPLFADGDVPGFEQAFSSGWTRDYGLLVAPDGQVGGPATERMLITVPEPSSWALFLTGFLGLGAELRRRRSDRLAQPGLASVAKAVYGSTGGREVFRRPAFNSSK